MVLEEKKLPYQYIEVNPYNKPDSLIRLNPRGLVPTLEYDNKPLFESGVINEFLEDAFPGHGPELRHPDPYQRARQRIWSDYVSTRILPALHRFLQFQPMTDEKGLDEKRQEFLGHLRTWAAEMDEEGPYFGGKDMTLVDIQLAPWLVSAELLRLDQFLTRTQLRMWVFDHYKGGLGIPEEGKGGEHEEIWNRWRKWAEAIESRDSIKATTSDREHFYQIYQRYADDKAQSELAKATRSGRGVP